MPIIDKIQLSGTVYTIGSENSGVTSGEVQTMIDNSLSGYVTTDTDQVVTSRKTFTNFDKAIEFKQVDNNSKVGFKIKNSASTANELAAFELRPNTFTIDGVQHPLMYFGHYRNNNIANAGVPQTVIGFRQYDQKNAAAYHYVLPLPEKAKAPFSLTTSFKDFYMPLGIKVDNSTMVMSDSRGVIDISSYIGGGSTYSAGRNIDITNGIISCTLNASNGSGDYSFREGWGTYANKRCAHAEGEQTIAGGVYSHAEGYLTRANGDYSHTEGYETKANNKYEHSSGQYNVSNTGSTTFGNGGNTLFSVGNGTSNSARHNAFEIRQNGDIYLNDGSKLQDTVSATAANTTALGGLSLVKLTQSEYDALATKDSNVLYVIVG